MVVLVGLGVYFCDRPVLQQRGFLQERRVLIDTKKVKLQFSTIIVALLLLWQLDSQKSNLAANDVLKHDGGHVGATNLLHGYDLELLV